MRQSCWEVVRNRIRPALIMCRLLFLGRWVTKLKTPPIRGSGCGAQGLTGTAFSVDAPPVVLRSDQTDLAQRAGERFGDRIAPRPRA